MPVGVLENEFLRIEYLQEAGPRIVRLFYKGLEENLLADMQEFTIPTPYGEYHFYGGHRLWHAPEAMPRSYIPDNTGLEIQSVPGGLRLVGAEEAPTGVQKSIEIRLVEGKASAILEHRLENVGMWPVDLAPWAITQMRLGGVGVIPQQTPSDPRNLLLPDRLLAIWSYTSINDPRLHLADDFILIDGQPAQPPCKIGVVNRRGWTGYLYKGVFFIKRFHRRLSLPHPDYGCNNEVYVDHRFLEVETLGPMVHLDPGQSVTHTETWELTGGLENYPPNLEGIREIAKQLDLMQT
jgi:hypothetical protein